MCRVPVFGRNRGSTDNSLIAFDRSIVVENNYGYTGPEQVPPSTDPFRNTPTTEPGVTRVVVDYENADHPEEPFVHPADVLLKLEPAYSACRCDHNSAHRLC